MKQKRTTGRIVSEARACTLLLMGLGGQAAGTLTVSRTLSLILTGITAQYYWGRPFR